MKRLKWVLAATLGLLLAAPLAAAAQRMAKVPLIGVLCSQFCLPFTMAERVPEGRVFLDSLRELGYVDGRNIALDLRGAGVAYDRLPRAGNEFVRRHASVIVAVGLSGTQIAKKVTGTIPVVMVDVPDAVESGIVESLARPGGNITGLTTPLGELAAKQLELLTEVVPRLSRVAVLTNPTNPEHAPTARALRVVAAGRGIELQFLEARSRAHSELESVFLAIRRSGAGALLVLRDPVLYGGEVALFAVKNRVPTISTYFSFAQAAGLMAYGPDRMETMRSTALYISKILQGRKPADLPVERPSRFEFVINLTTAKALGLRISQSILLRADQVIE